MQTVHVAPGPQIPVIANAAPASRANVQAVRGLAITQLIIGILTTILGIVIASQRAHIWAIDGGVGILGGILIIVTGALGISYSHNLNSGGLNGVYMAFSVISTCVSFVIGIIFAVALLFLGSLGIHTAWIIMMVVEFFVSIVAAVFCCQNNNSCCGRQQTTGVIIQPQQPFYITSTHGYAVSNPPVVSTTAGQVPPANTGQAPQVLPQGQVPQAYPPVQVSMYQQQYPMQTNVTYSQAPPAYTEAAKQ